MRKEDKLLGLREEILTKKSEQTPIEQFQNKTIRPILKYQHTILIVFFSSNVHVQYIVSANFSTLKKQNQLKLFVSKQLAFRAQLLGIVTGLFTDAELKVLKNKFQIYNVKDDKIQNISKVMLLNCNVVKIF